LSNKEATIEAQNEYLDNYKLITSPGFCDDGTVLLGKIKNEKEETDYSEFTLNKFICTYYNIEGAETPIFVAVMGPYFGTRLFITPIKLESAGKRLLKHL
jgi:hypothetical protein